jgi:hypothetical protein
MALKRQAAMTRFAAEGLQMQRFPERPLTAWARPGARSLTPRLRPAGVAPKAGWRVCAATLEPANASQVASGWGQNWGQESGLLTQPW